MLSNIFSNFYWKGFITETPQIQSSYLNKIISNYNFNPKASPDWDVHTSYNNEENLPYRLEWWDSIQHYKKYVNSFIQDFLNDAYNWEINGTPWYTTYGKNQSAVQHEHFPDQFSFVHFLQFNPKVHKPLTFINPNSLVSKYMLEQNNFKEKINFDSTKQSLYHPLYSPLINEGDYIIFPSNLEHLVEKSTSEELRTTIAFNFNIL